MRLERLDVASKLIHDAKWHRTVAFAIFATLISTLVVNDKAQAIAPGSAGLRIHILGYDDDGKPANLAGLGQVHVTGSIGRSDGQSPPSEIAQVSCTGESGGCLIEGIDGYDPSGNENGIGPGTGIASLTVDSPPGLYTYWAGYYLKGGWSSKNWMGYPRGCMIATPQQVACGLDSYREVGGILSQGSANQIFVGCEIINRQSYEKNEARSLSPTCGRIRMPFNQPGAEGYLAVQNDKLGEPVVHIYVQVFKERDVGRLDGTFRMRTRAKVNTLSPNTVGHGELRTWRFRSQCKPGTGPCSRIKLTRGYEEVGGYPLGTAAPSILKRKSSDTWTATVSRSGLGYGCQGSIWKGAKEEITVVAGDPIRKAFDITPPIRYYFHARGRPDSVKAIYAITFSRFSKSRARTKCGKALRKQLGLRVGKKPRIVFKATMVRAGV